MLYVPKKKKKNNPVCKGFSANYKPRFTTQSSDSQSPTWFESRFHPLTHRPRNYYRAAKGPIKKWNAYFPSFHGRSSTLMPYDFWIPTQSVRSPGHLYLVFLDGDNIAQVKGRRYVLSWSRGRSYTDPLTEPVIMTFNCASDTWSMRRLSLNTCRWNKQKTRTVVLRSLVSVSIVTLYFSLITKVIQL